MADRRFSEQEMALIIRRATELQDGSDGGGGARFSLAEIQQIASEAGIAEPFVGLMTAAWTHDACVAWEEADDVRVGAVATVGLGTTMAAGVTPPAVWQPSTINVIVLLDADLERAAAVNGVITATDILGEKPMLAATERGLHHDDLTVADVMTPAARMEVLLYEDVRAARVGHIVETLRRAGRQHALVVDFDELPPLRPLAPPGHRTMVRGIFSLSQIARQLGVQMQGGGEVALTFSEVESAIR